MAPRQRGRAGFRGTMAQYEHLPIYKKTYDLLLLAMQATKLFPREYKYTLGQNIKDEIVALVVFIYRAIWACCEPLMASMPAEPSARGSSLSS
jgi:hypothetical protein